MIKRTAFSVAATLVLLLPAAHPVHAASCKGASHAVTLSAGAASPRAGTTATGITFSVLYASNAGCVPSSVTVDIAGLGTYQLASGGSDFAAGETFTRTMTLPAGVYTYTFAAVGGTGTGEQSIILTSVNPDAVAISAPTPVPTPSPTPVPPPPPPTPLPAPPNPGAPPPAAPAPAAPAAPAPPAAPAAPAATPAPVTVAVPPPSTPAPGSDGAPAGSAGPSPAPTADPAPAEPAASPEPADEHDSWIGAPLFSAGATPVSPVTVASIGGDDGGAPMGLLLSITAAMGMLVAAIVLARRRSRPGEPAMASAAVASATVAGAAAAAPEADSGIPTIPVSVPIPDDGSVPAVRPLPPMRELIPPVNPAMLDEDESLDVEDAPRANPEEQGIPRWLRPSVREARFANDRNHRRNTWG